MKKIILKNVENTLSRKEMRAIKGGYSMLYCVWHSMDGTISVGGNVIYQHDGLNYRDCRNGLVSH